MPRIKDETLVFTSTHASASCGWVADALGDLSEASSDTDHLSLLVSREELVLKEGLD